MEQPLVSIITITRNRGNLISRCIKSIQDQTFKNFEHIIVDGASSDNTKEVVHSFTDKRIVFVEMDSDHSDMTSCYNEAFARSRGKYLSFLDDDDEYLPEKIQKQVDLIETLPDDYGLVYCWMTYYNSKTCHKVREHKPQVRGNVADDVVEKPTVSGTPTFLIKKDKFLDLGGWVSVEECGLASDWAFGARFCQKWKVDYVPESLIKVYVNHGAVRMSESDKYYKNNYLKTIKFHNYFINTYSDIFEKYPWRAWLHYKMLSYSYFRLNNYKKGINCYLKMLKRKPTLSNICLPIKVVVKSFVSKYDKLFNR